jgi:hypothetical protein
MEVKEYIGSVKTKTFSNGGSVFKVSFSKDDLKSMANHLNERGYVNLDMIQMKAPDKFGRTHYIKYDTWKPTMQAAKVPARAVAPVIKSAPSGDPFNIADIPF